MKRYNISIMKNLKKKSEAVKMPHSSFELCRSFYIKLIFECENFIIMNKV